MKFTWVLLTLQVILLIIMADILYTMLKVLREPLWLQYLERWANQ